MKKLIVLCLFLVFIFVLVGCEGEKTLPQDEAEQTIQMPYKLPYDETNDGEWICNGILYKYRLENKLYFGSGIQHEVVSVYLSNTEKLPDDFSPEEAILVELYELINGELPNDRFCYSADKSRVIELNVNDKEHIVDLLNNSSWVDSLTNCASDFIFYTQKQEVLYHSECGTFNDITNQRSVTVSDEERIRINNALSISAAFTDVTQHYCYVLFVSDNGFIASINGIGNVFVKFDAADSKIQIFDTVVIQYDSEELVTENGQFEIEGEQETYTYKLNDPKNVRKADPTKGEPVFG